MLHLRYSGTNEVISPHQEFRDDYKVSIVGVHNVGTDRTMQVPHATVSFQHTRHMILILSSQIAITEDMVRMTIHFTH
jgi:hypothetical protein